MCPNRIVYRFDVNFLWVIIVCQTLGLTVQVYTRFLLPFPNYMFLQYLFMIEANALPIFLHNLHDNQRFNNFNRRMRPQENDVLIKIKLLDLFKSLTIIQDRLNVVSYRMRVISPFKRYGKKLFSRGEAKRFIRLS